MTSDQSVSHSTITSTTEDGLRPCPKCGLKLPIGISNCPDDGTFLSSELGAALSEHYDMLEEIGSGGNGIVYKARHRLLNYLVAIKMLRADKLEQNIIRRFNQEAKAISTLDHPTIVKLKDYGLTELGQPYMVLDYIPGITLSVYLESNVSLPLKEFLKVFIQCSEGLQHAHDAGIFHRDLKPSNIMFTDDFKVRIVDFGIAKIIDQADQASGLTKTGEIFGSPKYMSPEQASGKRVDHRSDIYSLGIVMFEALTGSVPFSGNNTIDVLTSHINAKAPSVASLNPNTPSALNEVVSKCLIKDPTERFQSMNDLRTALLEVKAGPKKASSPVNKVKKSDFLLAATAVVLIIGIVALAQFMISLSKPPEEQNSRHHELEEFVSFSNEGKLARDYFKAHMQSKKINLDTNFAASMDVNDESLREFDNTNVTEELVMRGSKLTGPGLAHLIHLPLKRLAVSTSNMPNRAIDEIKHMKKLEILDISGTNVDDQGLIELAKLPKLKTLYIKDEEKISNRGLANLAAFPALDTLYLSKDEWLRAEGIRNLAKCPSLRVLKLDRSGISAPDLVPIKGLKHLKVLTLRDLKLGDDAIKNLEGTGIEHLDLQHIAITDRALTSLSKMPQLKEVGLNKNTLTPSAIDDLQRKRPELLIWRRDDVPFNTANDNR
ncbi:MAG: protein kinase [Cyanobacteria bacterium SZAS-4]|nr:protein kinase [Cyanobacteria bacterium SZAS-4]